MQPTAARVTVIPAYTRSTNVGPVGLVAKKRVAAYARVSTDNEEQLTSYEAQVDYYGALLERYETVKGGLARIANQRQERSANREKIVQFLKKLEQSDALLQEFDEGLWYATVDKVTVYSEHDITFTFKDGYELPRKI